VAKRKNALMQTLAMDGRLEEAEALKVLSEAARAATHTLPAALAKCTTQEQMQKVIADRDAVMLAYTNSLVRSLRNTGPLFEQTAQDLDGATATVLAEAKNLKTDIQAIGLLADLVRLASALALAFA